MTGYHSAPPKAHITRPKRYWPLVAALAVSAFAFILTLKSQAFGLVDLSLTLLSVSVATPILRKQPIGQNQKILYFQLLLLLALYLGKGLNVAWLIYSRRFDILPDPLYNGLVEVDFSPAFQMSCVVCILLALLLYITPKQRVFEAGAKPIKFNALALIFLTLALFALSFLVRLAPIDGLPGAVGYVISHRGTPFAFALLVFALLEQEKIKLAKSVFLLWLGVGFVMFVFFGSKSYIFLPVIFLYVVYLFSGQLIFSKSLTLASSIGLISIYPVFNIYRSIYLSGGPDLTAISNLVSMNYLLAGQLNLADALQLYFSQVIDRFVGFEWFLVVLDADSSGILPESSGFIDNTLNINDTMRFILGLEGREIGIAPSLLGASYLITRNPIMMVFLSIIFCLSFIWLNHAFTLIFPRLRGLIIAPISLIIFSVITDGLITSLYWDIPALALVCAAFNTLIKPKKSTFF